MNKVAIAVVAAALAACGGKRVEQRPVNVTDADYGRLQAGQTQLVDAARADLSRARDELSRAKLRVTEARNEEGLAKADQQAVDAAQTRAEALAKGANASRDPAQLEQARLAKEAADLRKRTADAHTEYARRLTAHRGAEVAAGERRVEYESARVELAKLQALQQAQIPAATKYDAAKLEAQVAQARKEAERAEGEVQKSQGDVAAAQQAWQDLNRQLQAHAGATLR